MPSDVDQAAPQQSIEERFGAVFSAPEVEEAPEETVDQAEVTEEQVDDTPQEAEAVDEIEIEVEGWKGKIPAKLKAEIDKGSDYTRKTQELAETRRVFEAQQRAIYEQQQFMQSSSKELEQYRQIEAQLEQYRGVDLSQIDGETLSRMSMAAANLREERAKLKETIEGKQAQFKGNMLKNWDEMTNRAKDVIVKMIPNWPTVAPQVAQYALNEGFQYEHITGHDRQTGERVGPGVVDPVFARTLHKAMQWDQLQASKATATGKVAKAPPIVKTGAPTNIQSANAQKALMAQHKQKGSVDTAAALLKKFF
jgi:hypothetical protein